MSLVEIFRRSAILSDSKRDYFITKIAFRTFRDSFFFEYLIIMET